MASPCPAAGSGRGERSLPLVPAPRSLVRVAGVATLGPGWTIDLEDTVRDVFAARLLADEIASSFGWNPPVVAAGAAAGPSILLSTAPSGAPAFPRQSYALSIRPRRVTVRASSPQGRFYAIQTLRQIVRGSPDATLPCLDIVDWPALAWRGASDDIARGQVSTPRDFRDLMSTLAYYKVNLYALYMESAPTLPAAAARGVTAEELSALAAEARRHYITVLPIYQAMGYSEEMVRTLERQGPRWLWSHLPRGAPPSPFSPWATHAIARRIDAIAAAVPSPWLGIGGDELGTFGLDHPAAAGVDSAGATHAEYVRYLGDHLHRVGQRRAVVYGDFVLRFPRVLASLDRSTAIVDWNYDPADSFPSIRRLLAAGFQQVFVSSGLWNWNTFYPNYERGLANTRALVDSGKAAGAAGAITSAWGDNGTECLRENNRLGYAYGAAAAWQPKAPAIEPFFDDFAAVEYGARGPALGQASRLVGLRSLAGIDYAGRAFHRLPRVRRAGPAWRDEMLALRADMDAALRLIDEGSRSVRRGRDHLSALAHAARRYRYLADRELAMDAVAARLADPTSGAQAGAARDLDSLAREYGDLVREYPTLWLAKNKRSGLDYDLARLERQAGELRALRGAALAGRLCVWSPGNRPLVEDAAAAATERRP